MNKYLARMTRNLWLISSAYLGVLTLTGLLAANRISLGAANRFNSFAGLVGSVSFSIALPILIRSLAYRKKMESHCLDFISFMRMKYFALFSVGIGLIFTLFSILIPVYTIHLYLSLLAGIYGIYSQLPFSGVIKNDMAAFGVSQNNE